MLRKLDVLSRLLAAVTLVLLLPLLLGASMSQSTFSTATLDTIQALTAAGNITVKDSAGNGLVTFADDGTTGSLWADTIRAFTANGNVVIKDQAGNTLFTIADGGTVGNITATGTVAGLGIIAGGAAGRIQTNSGIDLTLQWSDGRSMFVQDSSANRMATFFDDGTTGSMQLTGTKSRGTTALSVGTATVTVNSGAVCTCTEVTDATKTVGCSVTTTTLTITGTGSDTIAYICL